MIEKCMWKSSIFSNIEAWKRATLLQTNSSIREIQRILIRFLVFLQLRSQFYQAFFMVACKMKTKSHGKY